MVISGGSSQIMKHEQAMSDSKNKTDTLRFDRRVIRS